MIGRPPIFCLALCSIFVGFCSYAQGQHDGHVAKLGFLSAASASAISARAGAFRQGLRELGYMEGNNILIESRHANGQVDALNALALELVGTNPELIVTAGPTATHAAKYATAKIPIVMAADSDPVRSGAVVSLSRPGGNITGLSVVSPEIAGKRLELLKEISPNVSHVTVLGNSNVPGNAEGLRELQAAAAAMRLQLKYTEVPTLRDMEIAFQDAAKEYMQAVIVLPNPVAISQRKQVVGFAEKSRLPTAYYHPEYVQAGGLMFYGPSVTDLFRRAATFVDKLLKGAKPADLPVEQPTKFELVINLRTARQIGLTIPPNVLARADRVIK